MIANFTFAKFVLRRLLSVGPAFLLSMFLVALSMNAQSQTVSIGMPVDGVEGGQNGSFTVFIEGGGVNTTGSPIQGVISFGGWANLGFDFMAVNFFTIPVGANSAIVDIEVIDDSFIELTKILTAHITSIINATVGTGTSETSILDDDFAQVQVSVGSPVNATETGNLTFDVFFEGGLVNATGASITGEISYSGTATEGVDFSGSSAFSINSPSNSATISIGLIDDVIAESTENVVVTISNLSVGTVLNSTSSASIFDNDSGEALLSIVSINGGVEGTSNASFWVYLADGGLNTTGAPITGDIAYSGTASNGLDYTAPVTFSIPNGVSNVELVITLIDDGILELDETVIATISNLNTGAIVIDSQSVTIQDDESDSLLISIGSPIDALEGTSDISVDIFLEGGATNTAGFPIIGTVTYSVGSAFYGSDYTPVTNFSIPDGASSTTITITVLDDFLYEPTETLILGVAYPNIGTIGTQTVVANIIDDDAGTLSMSIAATDGAEGGADAGVVISLDNGAINDSGLPITGWLDYGGSAILGTDCGIAPYIFSIANGASSTQFSMPVVDDNYVECDESLIAMITNHSAGSVSSAIDTAYIIDNECATAAISIHSPSDGEELGADVQFIVSFDGGLINVTGAPITGTLDLSAGTATPGVDFVDQQVFQIAYGANSAVIDVTVIDDFDIEINESIVATISNPMIGTIGTPTSIAYIVDNDSISEINPDLIIYPNPMSLNLSFKSEYQMKSYSIVDLKGRELMSGGISSTEFVLETKPLSDGSYFVRVLFENGNYVSRKFIKI